MINLPSYMFDWLLIIIYGFINDKNRKTLKQKNLQALLMRIKEDFEHRCIIGDFNCM